MTRISLLALAATACQAAGFGGTEPLPNSETQTPVEYDSTITVPCPASEFAATCDGAPSGDSELVAEGGVGMIAITHIVDLPDCPELDAVAVRTGHVIDIVYDEGTATCGADCAQVLTYELGPLDPGTWRVTSGGDVATTVVR